MRMSITVVTGMGAVWSVLPAPGIGRGVRGENGAQRVPDTQSLH